MMEGVETRAIPDLMKKFRIELPKSITEHSVANLGLADWRDDIDGFAVSSRLSSGLELSGINSGLEARIYQKQMENSTKFVEMCFFFPSGCGKKILSAGEVISTSRDAFTPRRFLKEKHKIFFKTS